MALPARALSLLTLSTVTVTVDSMNSAAVKTDWFSAIERQRAKVKQAEKKLRTATNELDAAELELDRLLAASGQGAR